MASGAQFLGETGIAWRRGLCGVEFWDQFFRQRRESGHDLDWEGLWTGPFLLPLRKAGVRTILELGCGTGHDAVRLADAGYSVTAIDLSGEAIEQAQARFGSVARFVVADMTQGLPFPGGGFDAVMFNVAMRMFPGGVTRAVFAEVGRLVRPGGLFLFHVNALEDRPLAARSLPARELEPDYVAEESGQTVHFFSEAYLRGLLGGYTGSYSTVRDYFEQHRPAAAPLPPRPPSVREVTGWLTRR